MRPGPAAVIFDMDGVLCRYDFDRRLALMAEMTGVEAKTIKRVIFDEGFDESADSGGYSAESYHEEFCRRLGAPLSVEQWLEARAKSMQPNLAVLDMARRVALDRKVAMLTNNGPLLEAHIDRVFPDVSETFGEHVYFSCSLGAAKPQVQAFQRVTERLQASPAESLFIDDSAEYVAGAVAAGLMAHHFQSIGELEAELRGYGLLA
ncbi:MAG: HAD family phosphatase [Gammaproteobacteria bacterium]|nr:HAD family phosphatase [Gammaproteobacteria bacterium]